MSPREALLKRIALSSFCLVALGLGLFQLASVRAPIVHEHHNWRQADVYSTAYTFHEEALDFFHPRIDFWRGPTGIVGMEAPVYPALASLAMYGLGEHPRAARFVTWLCFIIAVGFAGLRLQPEERSRARMICFFLAAALSPMALLEFRMIQADGLSLAATWLAAVLFLRFGRTGRRGAYLAGMLFYTIAVVTKSPALMAGPALFLLTWIERPPGLRVVVLRGLGFVVPIAAAFAWFSWATHLTATYEVLTPYFNLNFRSSEVWNNLKSFANWRHTFGFLTGTYAVQWVLAPSLVAGIVLGLARRTERRLALAMLVYLAATIFFCLCFSSRSTVHWYYAMIMLPPVVHFTTVGLTNLFDPDDRPLAVGAQIFVLASFAVAPWIGRWAGGPLAPSADGPAYEQTWFRPMGLALLAGALLLAAWLPRRMRRPVPALVLLLAAPPALARAVHDNVEAFDFRTKRGEWARIDALTGPLQATINAHTTRADLLAVDGYIPWYLHLARRRGFSANWEVNLEDLACKTDTGIAHYLHFIENEPLPQLMDRAQPIARERDFVLYRLEPPLDGKCPPVTSLAALADKGREIASRPEVTILAVHAFKCLSAQPRDGALIVHETCSSTTSQRFRVALDAEGVSIEQVDRQGSRFCATFPPARDSDEDRRIRMHLCGQAPGQRLTIRQVRTRTYLVEDRASSQVWDMPTDNKALHRYSFHGGPTQQFRFNAPSSR